MPGDHFPGAIQIVEIFHARQHLWDVARKLYPAPGGRTERWMAMHQDALLDEGKIEDLVKRSDLSIRSILNYSQRYAPKPTTLTTIRNGCATRSSVRNISSSLHRHRRHRSMLQKLFWVALQAVRHVPDGSQRQCHPGSTLLPIQRSLRRLLGGPECRLTSTFMSFTRAAPSRF